jgi:cyclohexadienyl dehydratase
MAGKFDIAMGGISITVQRTRSVFFSAPILRDGKTACFRCADAAKFTDLASIDVTGVTVIVNPGGTNEAFDGANLKAATIIIVESNAVVYDRVLDGTADVMISDGTEVELQVALNPGKLCGLKSGALFTFDQKAYMVRRDVLWKQ